MSEPEPHGRAAFVRFLLAGGFNAATGVLFSQLWYLLLGRPVLAFVLGYALSLSLSYLVNALLVFRAPTVSWRGYLAFVTSYVPNFTIQFGLVTVMTTWLGVPPLLAYLIGVALAVPITFLILARLTFRPGGPRGSGEPSAPPAGPGDGPGPR